MSIWLEGVEKRVYPSLDSTMSEAVRLRESLAGPTWILALEQSAGRGRRGRDWIQPNGNFAATLIWQPEGAIENRALRSFVAALALRDAFVSLTGHTKQFSLKWPNDLLLGGGKVAGILLESIGDHLAIGFGINLLHAPSAGDLEPEAIAPVSLASKMGITVEPEEFLECLAPAFATWEIQFSTYGFEPIRSAWLSDAAKLGEVIRARMPGSEIAGTFETVDEQGALVLKAADGRHRISAADVFF